MQHSIPLFLQLFHGIQCHREQELGILGSLDIAKSLVRNKRIKCLGLVLDLIAQAIVSRPDDVAATTASITLRDGDSLLTNFHVVHSNDELVPSAVEQHIQTIMSLLLIITGNRPKSSPFEEGRRNLLILLYKFGWPKFLKRVNQHRHSFILLQDLFRANSSNSALTPNVDRSKVEYLFRSIESILDAVDLGADTIDECAGVVHERFFSCIKEGIFIVSQSKKTGALRIEAPLFDGLEKFVAEHFDVHQLFSVQRWVYKVFSLELLVLRLCHTFYSHDAQELLQGKIKVEVFQAEEPQAEAVHCIVGRGTSHEIVHNVIREAVIVHNDSSFMRPHLDNVERQAQFADYALAGFGNTPAQRPKIHCELSMLKNLHERGLTDTVVPYVGMSKLSCKACSEYLRAYSLTTGQDFQTSGTDNMYVDPSWVYPSIVIGSEDDRIREMLVKALQSAFVERFQTWLEEHRPIDELWATSKHLAWLGRTFDMRQYDRKKRLRHSIANVGVAERVYF
ncbi:hypothetical protein MPER_12883 [Moniliophthora perniciosa FA553]|nr:hypothetical protein MPER_12883 [Moniliophthora perniciosa FA553]